jgi:hypothetical protein
MVRDNKPIYSEAELTEYPDYARKIKRTAKSWIISGILMILFYFFSLLIFLSTYPIDTLYFWFFVIIVLFGIWAVAHMFLYDGIIIHRVEETPNQIFSDRFVINEKTYFFNKVKKIYLNPKESHFIIRFKNGDQLLVMKSYLVNFDLFINKLEPYIEIDKDENITNKMHLQYVKKLKRYR